VGANARGSRLFVKAVLYRYRAGIPWRDLPESFGDFRKIHTSFSRWNKTGAWQRVFEALAQDADNEYTNSRSYGCPRQPDRFFLMLGQVHDLEGAGRLLPKTEAGIII
jgi:transposase